MKHLNHIIKRHKKKYNNVGGGEPSPKCFSESLPKWIGNIGFIQKCHSFRKKLTALVYNKGPVFFAVFEIIPIPNLPNVTDLQIPTPNRGFCPLPPAPIPP
jgi:hypothetical protein